MKLPEGVIHATEFAVKDVPYLELLYFSTGLPEGKYAVRWHDNQWYVSTQEAPRTLNWTSPELPVPEWYVGPLPDMEAALTTLTLLSDITE